MKNIRITKKEKRRVFIVSCITITLMFFVCFNLITVWKKIVSLKNQKEVLLAKLDGLKEEKSYLEVEVKKLQDPDYIAKYAREKYFYSKDNEFNIKITDEDNK